MADHSSLGNTSIRADVLVVEELIKRSHRGTEMHENEIGTAIVDSAVRLHKDLGPGLLETVYEVTLAEKLRKRGLSVERQAAVAIDYEGQVFDEGFRANCCWKGDRRTQFS